MTNKAKSSISGKLSYADYLQLDQILNAQATESAKCERDAPDETLFIIVHQVYELWFKQILHELGWVMKHFNGDTLADEAMGACVSKLERIRGIQKLMLDQVDVLETMTPMDFLDFRDLLYPASGFQSFQFRMLENLLGLTSEQRLEYDKKNYIHRVDKDYQERVLESEKGPSLFVLVERWLERTPFVEAPQYLFWKDYRDAVNTMLHRDEQGIRENPNTSEETKLGLLSNLQKTRDSFEILYDAKKLETAIANKNWRLSHQATLAALFIQLYRNEPALQLPHRFLSLLSDIDENFTIWRYRHAQMALRMIGTKFGTGGSSGAEYLYKATQSHRIFFDLTRLATFLIPRRLLPDLPSTVKTKLAFQYQRKQ